MKDFKYFQNKQLKIISSNILKKIEYVDIIRTSELKLDKNIGKYFFNIRGVGLIFNNNKRKLGIIRSKFLKWIEEYQIPFKFIDGTIITHELNINFIPPISKFENGYDFSIIFNDEYRHVVIYKGDDDYDINLNRDGFIEWCEYNAI